MEGPAGTGGLSGADKEQLREKLALLRWEYSETISRLRRARRAERARGHGQGAAADGRQEQSPAGSRDNVSPNISTRGTAQLQTKTCSDFDTEKAASVPFKHVPEFPSHEASPQDSLWAESKRAGREDRCCGAIRDAPEQKTPQASRSWMKLRRRVKAPISEKKESIRDETVKNPVAGIGELRSPVFRRSSFSHSEEHAQRASRLVQAEENSSSPRSETSGAAQDAPGDSIPPGVPEPFPSALWDPSHIWQPESPGVVAMAGNTEPAQACSEKGVSPLLDSSGEGGKESSSIKNQSDTESACEDKGEILRLLDLMSENEVSPADGNKPITDKGKSHEGDHSDANGFNAFPTDLAVCNVGELSENQQLETESRLLHPEEVAAPESALDSCTVVEGLLFPVEYYVRTTRRMSNCQRKVDLDAVILSQLGRSKKGQRSKGKQRDMNSDWPSQERVENDLGSRAVPYPSFLGAESDSANVSSPQKSLPASSGSSTSLGSVSQNGAAGTKRDRRQSQRKLKGRRKSARTHSAHQEGREGLSVMVRESSSLLPNECQSEKEICEADLEKSSLEEQEFPAAAASGLGEMAVTGAVQPVSANPPEGSQVLGKCWEALPEQAQNPLQNSDSLNPQSETFASCVGDLEANFSVCHADKRLAEHVKNQAVQESCRAEQLQAINAPPRRSLRSSARRRASQAAEDESKRARSDPVGSEGPAPLGLLAMDPDAGSSLFSFRKLQWVAPTLGVQDFHLPDEEFGQLKLEKLESSHVNDLEDFVPQDAVPSKDTWDVQMNPEENSLKSNLISPLKNEPPKAPQLESPASKRELSPHELLFTPMGTVLAGAPTQPESQISSSIFPVVGATPAVLPPVRSEIFPSEIFPSLPSVPPSQAIPPSSKGASLWVADNGEYKDPAVPLHLGSGGAGPARREEEQGTAFPVGAETGPDNESGEAVASEKQQQSESEQQGSIRASPAQNKGVAEQSTPVRLNSLTEESLQLLSKLKDSSSSCAVDVSAVWWEVAGSLELCVVTACESSVSLWKPLAPDGWGKVYTWQLGEIPVIQIVPLPDTCNLVCIALGDLEIGEVRLLLYSSENDSFKQSLVRTGNIKAVLGLKDRRLVSSSRTVCEQQVEVVSLSETGRSRDGRTLMPPEETVLAFAEVEGLRDALVGTTAVNDIVVWNLQTGQLLKKMQLGYSYPASVCHQAYSDSGLLFVVLSHPHAKESESCRNPAFRVVAFNPKTARSTGVMFSSLPAGHAGRYLEGDVKDACVAAVLTSGAVVVWDLLLGRCMALLPPGPQGDWALARWATTTACLLAGQRDGTVCLYRYRPP